MKKYIFILLLLLSSCFHFLGEENPLPENETTVPSSPDLDPEHILWKVSLWKGEWFVYPQLANVDSICGKYVFEYSTPSVASVKLFYDAYNGKARTLMKALNEGITWVYLKDTICNDTVQTFYIEVCNFEGKRIEDFSDPSIQNIHVEAKDENVKQKIEKELWLEMDNIASQHNIYQFSWDTKTFTVSSEQSNICETGVYEWNIDSLTLKYDNRIEKYGFSISEDRNGYVLNRDRTLEYQTIYPEAGIAKVIMRYKWFDMTRLGLNL